MYIPRTRPGALRRRRRSIFTSRRSARRRTTPPMTARRLLLSLSRLCMRLVKLSNIAVRRPRRERAGGGEADARGERERSEGAGGPGGPVGPGAVLPGGGCSVCCRSRRGRDPAPGQALPQAGPGQLGRAVHRRVHVAARAAAEPAGAARHRHLRRGRQRRGQPLPTTDHLPGAALVAICFFLLFYQWLSRMTLVAPSPSLRIVPVSLLNIYENFNTFSLWLLETPHFPVSRRTRRLVADGTDCF